MYSFTPHPLVAVAKISWIIQKLTFIKRNGCRWRCLWCHVGVMQSTEQVAGGIHFSGCTTPALFVGERSPISLFRSNMPALYVKQRCDPDRFFFFPPSRSLKVSPPTWQNLLVFRSWEMQITCGEKRQGDRERERGWDRRKWDADVEIHRDRWERDRGRERETRGNKGRQEERHYSDDLRGFCLHGCDVTHQQSMFWSERSTRMQGFKKKTKTLLPLCPWSCEARSRIYRSGTHTHTCTNTHMLVSVLDFLLQ